MKTRIKYYLLIMALAATASCIKEPLNDIVKEEKTVMLKVSVPNSATRAIGATEENTIETLDILAFMVDDDSGEETLLYWAGASRASNSDAGLPVQAFNATLRIKEFKQRFVLITNARDKIATLIGNRIDGCVGMEKEDMLSQLVFELDGSNKWNAAGSSDYTAIPMWGETTAGIVNETTTSLNNGKPIDLLRMLAKIEVKLDVGNYPALVSTFKLKSVHVYNISTSGRVVPKPNEAGGVQYIDQNMIPLKASLPEYVTLVNGPIAYNDFSSPGIANTAMKGAIYLFEREAENQGNFLNETCIVVGGLYGSDVQESYYRLDFFASDGTTYLDILRNSNYMCNIIAVNGRGFPSVDEAYRAKSNSMEVEIIEWNAGSIPDIDIGGQYTFKISQDYFEFDENARTLLSADNILTVSTNYPGGWTAEVWGNKAGTITSSWLSLSSYSGTGNPPNDISLLMGANFSTDRTAYIHVKAGAMTYIVTVLQHGKDPFEVAKTGDALPRIYIDGTGANATLRLTEEISYEAAFFQWGSIIGWNYNSTGSADYNPTISVSSNWKTTWDISTTTYIDKAFHNNVANLQAGMGDPCRLVGYSVSEIQNALNNNQALDNNTWRMPTKAENDAFIGTRSGWATSNPYGQYTSDGKWLFGDGFRSPSGDWMPEVGVYWSNEQIDPYSTNVLYVYNSYLMIQPFPNSVGGVVRCVEQEALPPTIIGITISPNTNLVIVQGGSLHFTATAHYSDGSTVTPADVIWTKSGGGGGIMMGLDGKMLTTPFVTVGEAIIIAKLFENPSIMNSVTITILPSAVTDIDNANPPTGIVTIDGVEWYVVRKETINGEGYAMLVPRLSPGGPTVFNPSGGGNDYVNSTLQGVMTSLYTSAGASIKTIAVVPNLSLNLPTSQTVTSEPTTEMAGNKTEDIFFAMSWKDVSNWSPYYHNFYSGHWWTRTAVAPAPNGTNVWQVNVTGQSIYSGNINATSPYPLPAVWVKYSWITTP